MKIETTINYEDKYKKLIEEIKKLSRYDCFTVNEGSEDSYFDHEKDESGDWILFDDIERLLNKEK
jgi:hypothetical protein